MSLGIVLNYCLIIRCLRCIIIFLNLRFGVINAVKTVKPIMKDEEYFTSYGYSPWTTGPKWYRELYIKRLMAISNEKTVGKNTLKNWFDPTWYQSYTKNFGTFSKIQ